MEKPWIFPGNKRQAGADPGWPDHFRHDEDRSKTSKNPLNLTTWPTFFFSVLPEKVCSLRPTLAIRSVKIKCLQNGTHSLQRRLFRLGPRTSLLFRTCSSGGEVRWEKRQRNNQRRIPVYYCCCCFVVVSAVFFFVAVVSFSCMWGAHAFFAALGMRVRPSTPAHHAPRQYSTFACSADRVTWADWNPSTLIWDTLWRSRSETSLVSCQRFPSRHKRRTFKWSNLIGGDHGPLSWDLQPAFSFLL